MSKQFEQLLILYKQVLAISFEIKTLILNANMDEALSKETYKTQIVNKINIIKKNITFNSKEKLQLEKIISDIQDSENENLSVLTNLKNETEYRLKILNSKEKLDTKYSQDTAEESSIIDISD